MRRLSLRRSPYYHFMEEDDNFRRWVESLERGSISTASVYFRRVGFLCRDLGVTPGEIAAMPVKEARNFIHDLISSLEGSGNVGSTARGYFLRKRRECAKTWRQPLCCERPKQRRTFLTLRLHLSAYDSLRLYQR